MEDEARYKYVKIKISFWGSYLPSMSAALKKGEIAYILGGLRPVLTEVNRERGNECFFPALGLWVERKPMKSVLSTGFIPTVLCLWKRRRNQDSISLVNINSDKLVCCQHHFGETTEDCHRASTAEFWSLDPLRTPLDPILVKKGKI